MISLTVISLSSCQHGAPAPPRLPLQQPIINHPAQDQNGNPIILNYCATWELNEDDKWVLVRKQDVRACTGILGLTSEDQKRAQKYQRDLETWIGENCGDKRNSQQPYEMDWQNLDGNYSH